MTELALPTSALAANRDRVREAWGLAKSAVVVASGLPVPVSGTDGHHEFHCHADHYYLTGLDRPGQAIAFDPDEGWTLFVHVASEVEKVWEGASVDRDAVAQATGVERVVDRTGLGDWMQKRAGGPLALLGNADLRADPAGYGIPDAAELSVDDDLSDRLRDEVWKLRRTKDAAELDLMRKAAAATRAGHLMAMTVAHPGMSEHDLKAEVEVEFLRAGGRRPAYHTIVAGGPNAAVLHSSPGHRPFAFDDLVLVDAGAEHAGYMCDVTRTFPAADAFTPEQRDLYDLVLAVQEAAVENARPGKEYRELHLEACAEIARGLVDMGILRGEPASLVERDVHALFFPHGLGHMIGLATHDVAGYLQGRERSERFGLEFLRTDLPLEPGYVVTIDWEKVDGLLSIGGVRIEDTVHVTADGPELLTAGIPKRREDVEALAAG
ncbi:MAG: aminopeptidase P N-terminal domain-containing protein [Planctomycetota bacterium]|jgi:Xaa-Pro aminopeptidase